MGSLNRAVRQAAALAPLSARALAIEAGVDPSLLTRILTSERNVTSEVASKLEVALYALSEKCLKGAKLIAEAKREKKVS